MVFYNYPVNNIDITGYTGGDITPVTIVFGWPSDSYNNLGGTMVDTSGNGYRLRKTAIEIGADSTGAPDPNGVTIHLPAIGEWSDPAKVADKFQGPVYPDETTVFKRLIMYYDHEFSQAYDISSSQTVNPAAIESALDKLTRIVQQLKAITDSAIRVPPNENNQNLTMELPQPEARANRVLTFDGSGNPGAELTVNDVLDYAEFTTRVTGLESELYTNNHGWGYVIESNASSLTGYNVTIISRLLLSGGGGDVTINSLANGGFGQILYIGKNFSDSLILKNDNAGAGEQPIFTKARADVTIPAGDYSGIILMCDGVKWVQIV